MLLITLKKEVQIDRFCCHDVFEVTQSGIRAVHVKPAGKREVVVTFKGIHPNTRDDGVVDYLSKYGKVVANKVIYGVFGEGPLRGIRNGDRSYKVEIKPTINIGTYHVLDGQKVTARYPGQQQTCARCFGTPFTCPGKGMARKCELESGPRVEFSQYIQDLWHKIGYSPEHVELDHGVLEEHDSQDGGMFTPNKGQAQETSKFAGVSVKMIPKETDQGEIVEFLIGSGLPESSKENISFKVNGTVIISKLQSSVCENLITAIHAKIFFGKRLYCNGIVPLTPEKTENPSNQPSPSPSIVITSPVVTSSSMVITSPVVISSSMVSTSPVVTSPSMVNTTPLVTNADTGGTVVTNSSSSSPNEPSPLPGLLSPIMSPNTFSQQYSETPDIPHLQLSNDQLVRRNSVSLRSPPQGFGPFKGSLADELLRPGIANPGLHYENARTLLSNLKEMTERFSDFASCDSSFSGDDSDISTENDNDGFKTQGRRKKTLKHRLSISPDRDSIMKKPNMASSPQSN